MKFTKTLLYIFSIQLLIGQTIQNNTNPFNITNNNQTQINNGDVAWVASSSLLVMLMTPALGLFYGGMVKTKNMISILAQCFAIYSITSLTWTLIGLKPAIICPSVLSTNLL